MDEHKGRDPPQTAHAITTPSALTFSSFFSTHQLNVLPLAEPATILAPYHLSPSLFLNEILFNLQEMFPLMGY